MNFMRLPAIVLHPPTTLCSVFPHYSFCSNAFDIFKSCAHNSRFLFSCQALLFLQRGLFLFLYRKKKVSKAVSLRDLYAPKRIFSRNTATKNHGRRQPCHDFLFCLAEKPLALECFAVLSGRFLPTDTAAGRGNTGCILRPRLRLWGKRFGQNRMNPYGRPPKAGGF